MKNALLTILAVLAATASTAACSRAPSAATPKLRILSWTGTSRVFPPGGDALQLGVSTTVDPFRSAHADTWLLSQGRSSLRSMILEPDGGWMERDGRRDPMPELMLKQERQQFAIYGQMQIALARAARKLPPSGEILVKGDGARSVDTKFQFSRAGRLMRAWNIVADSEKRGNMVPQEFRFSGEVRSNGLRWPQHLELMHGNAPYFTLDIRTFEAK